MHNAPLENFLPPERHLSLTKAGKRLLRLRPKRPDNHPFPKEDPLIDWPLPDCSVICSFEDRDCCPLTVCRFRHEGLKR